MDREGKMSKRNIAVVAIVAFSLTLLLTIVLFRDIDRNTNSSLAERYKDTWGKKLEAYLGTPEYKTLDPDQPLDEQTRIFKLGGRVFEVPKVFIDTHLGAKYEIEDIILDYVLPDYTSRADFENRQAYQQAHEQRRFAHMLLADAARRPTLDQMVSRRRNPLSLPKEEYIGKAFGLDYYKWYRLHQEKLIHYYDVYLKRDAEKITDWIECSTFERGIHIKFPSCSHWFEDHGLLYKISYNKANFLFSWVSLKISAIAFIDHFEIPTPEHMEPTP